MSWSLFKVRCNVLTGNPHVTTQLFANTIASAYHECMMLHFDSLTAGGKLTNTAPKLPLLQQQILTFCEANRQNPNDLDLLQQIGPSFIQYWTGAVIIGPTGITSVINPGSWTNLKVPPNTNFQIILNNLIVACRTHIMTITGQYVSTVIPSVTSPWSGALFQSMP